MASVIIGENAQFTEGTDNTPPVFVGGKVGLNFETSTLIFRLVGTGGASLTVANRTVAYGMLGLEVGIPIVRGKTVVRERETKITREQREIETIEKETVLLREVEVPLLLVTLDDQMVNFEFDRAELTPASADYLRRLGRLLSEQELSWGALRIEGHTDSVGADDYNDRLSAARAAAVRRALVAAGVQAPRLSSAGLGKRQPLDPEASELARARNRRVELSFSGVREPQRLRNALARLNLASRTPSTCGARGCR
jgi:outer membrane protein OmpA-like peptidoglycan-associated protein